MAVSYIKIDLNAFRRNVRKIRNYIKGEAGLLAVVKANAYGHGVKECLQVALKEGYEGAAVSRVTEGRELRRFGFNCPIYVLGLPLPHEILMGVDSDLILPVDLTVDIEAIEAAAISERKMAEVMIAIDSGMNRIGAHPDEVPQLLEKLKKCSHIHIRGTFTHMATADFKDKDIAQKQLQVFEHALSYMNITDDFVISAANSAGILDIPNSWHNLVRPGIIMYGLPPSQDMTHSLDVESVMSVITHVTHVQNLKKGEFVGYGASFVAEKDMHTATIPLGYADGYPRALSNKGCVLIGGKRCPIVGRICMDQFMVAVDETVKPGDEAVLVGKQGNIELSADEVAEAAGTISYEILCTWKRIPRVFIGE